MEARGPCYKWQISTESTSVFFLSLVQLSRILLMYSPMLSLHTANSAAVLPMLEFSLIYKNVHQFVPQKVCTRTSGLCPFRRRPRVLSLRERFPNARMGPLATPSSTVSQSHKFSPTTLQRATPAQVHSLRKMTCTKKKKEKHTLMPFFLIRPAGLHDNKFHWFFVPLAVRVTSHVEGHVGSSVLGHSHLREDRCLGSLAEVQKLFPRRLH